MKQFRSRLQSHKHSTTQDLTLKKHENNDYWKNSLRKNTHNETTDRSEENSEVIALTRKIKQLTDTNRKLRLKNSVLENRVVQLETYVSGINVFLLRI